MLLTCSTPPYEAYRAFCRAAAPEQAQIIVATLAPHELGDDAQLSALTELGRRVPWAHILLHVSHDEEGTTATVGKLAAHLVGACGCTTHDEPGRADLCSILCHVDPAIAVLRLMAEYHPHMPSTLEEELEAVVRAESTSAMTEPDCRRFSRTGLPRPDAIARLVKALRAVLALQANGELPVLLAALGECAWSTVRRAGSGYTETRTDQMWFTMELVHNGVQITGTGTIAIAGMSEGQGFTVDISGSVQGKRVRLYMTFPRRQLTPIEFNGSVAAANRMRGAAFYAGPGRPIRNRATLRRVGASGDNPGP